jgi:hypothetical protein
MGNSTTTGFNVDNTYNFLNFNRTIVDADANLNPGPA